MNEVNIKPVKVDDDLRKMFKAVYKALSRIEERIRVTEQKLDRVILSEDNANRGSKPKLSDADITWIKEQRASGETMKSIAHELAVTRSTVYATLKRHYAAKAKDELLLSSDIQTEP